MLHWRRGGQALMGAGLILGAAMISAEASGSLVHPATGHTILVGDDEPKTELTPAEALLEARLRLIEQGLTKVLPTLPPQEALALLGGIKTRIDAVLTTGKEHPAFAKTTPATLDDFEKLFWSMHVLSNQLTSAARFYEYAQALKATAKKVQPKKGDTADLSALQIDWAAIKTEITRLRERLTARERELRIARLKSAASVLNESRDVADRLLAALALDQDGDVLPQLLARDKTIPIELTLELRKTIDQARRAAGYDLLQKSRWLFVGLHWWTRGRYGLGTAGGGLMKDPAALNSPDVMFGLMMPIAQPMPTAPQATAVRAPVPLVDRRHHYLWQFETRQFASRGSESSTTNREYVSHTVTTTAYFY